MSMLHLTYQVPGDDFTRAGEASGDVKHKLKKLGYEPDAVRRVSIAMYEGEINMVIHAGGGGGPWWTSTRTGWTSFCRTTGRASPM